MKHRGFTLIELMVVISIISLLSSIILAGFSSLHDKMDNSYRVQTIQEFQKAILLARENLNGFPAAPLNETSGNGAQLICLDATQDCISTVNGFTITYKHSPTLNDTLKNYVKVQKQFSQITTNTGIGVFIDSGPYYDCYNTTDPSAPPYICPGNKGAVLYYYLHGNKADCGAGATGTDFGDAATMCTLLLN